MEILKPKPNWNGETSWEKLYDELVFSCCDCGLAHTFKFKVIKGKCYWRAKRNKKITKLMRAKKK